MKQNQSWPPPWWGFARDVMLFFVGVGGAAYETIVVKPPDLGIILAFLGVAGAPVIINKNKGNDDDPPPPGPSNSSGPSATDAPAGGSGAVA